MSCVHLFCGSTSLHYCDGIMGAMASQITSLTIVCSTIYSGADQRNIKAPRHWPFCGDFTGDRWIPRTKDQLFKVQIKENIKALRHWPLCTDFPAQMASNAENVSIWWRHHVWGCSYIISLRLHGNLVGEMFFCICIYMWNLYFCYLSYWIWHVEIEIAIGIVSETLQLALWTIICLV